MEAFLYLFSDLRIGFWIEMRLSTRNLTDAWAFPFNFVHSAISCEDQRCCLQEPKRDNDFKSRSSVVAMQ